jgi:high-affinity nickel-transport protein
MAMNDSFRSRVLAVYALLALANLAAWGWALLTFRAYPVQLGTAFLAYSLGLRHAFDADHIAAIDNVTRKLMQDGQRPAAVGLWFSLGHSTIVILASVAIAVFAAAFGGRLDTLQAIGGVAGTLVSAGFLFAIAVVNLVVLCGVWRSFRRLRAGEAEADALALLSGGGLLARLLRPLFRMIRASWHMYPLGVLFGLGFDTATEVGLLGISAAGASHGMPIWSILVFPALFTAGMTLVDATDSILMVGAYGWALARPLRKIYYNLTITSASVVLALVVGGVEALGLLGEQFGLGGWFWDGVARLNDHFGTLGAVVVALFLASWVISVLVFRLSGVAVDSPDGD